MAKAWKDDKRVLSYFYILKIIYTELISYYYDNSLLTYFGIDKKQELITKK